MGIKTTQVVKLNWYKAEDSRGPKQSTEEKGQTFIDMERGKKNNYKTGHFYLKERDKLILIADYQINSLCFN